jgi:GNAT superfamily N-acetyltransferase
MKDFVIRQMQFADLELAVSWATQEGWNPGLHDSASFFVADLHGFFVGELAGEPISCISAIAYDQTFGFIGLYIVHPAFRGQGFGWKTWQHGLHYLGDRAIGLEGVLAQQDNYRKSGFSLAYRNIRYQGAFPQSSRVPNSLQRAAEIPICELLAFDAQFFPASRPAFLQHWITQPDAIALVKRKNHSLMGYGMIRPCQTGWRIGPLFALNEETADELFLGLTAHLDSSPCFLDVPEPNQAALRFVERYHMTTVFETARMYTQPPPQHFIAGIFGVTTLELG